MPMIPIYDEPKVAPQITPDTRIDPRILMHAPGAFGQQLGADIQQVGGEISHVQDVAAQVAAQDTFNKAMPELQDLHNRVLQAVGSQLLQPGAPPLTQVFMDGYQAIARKYGDGLTGRAKFYFDKQANINATGLRAGVEAHQIQQITAHTVDVQNAGNANDKAMIASDPANQQYCDTLVSNIAHRTSVVDGLLGRPTVAEVQAATPDSGGSGPDATADGSVAVPGPAGSTLLGGTPEVPTNPAMAGIFAGLSPSQQAEVSHARAIQVGSILSQPDPNIPMAKGIFDRVKDQMTSSDRQTLDKYFKSESSTKTANQAVDEIWNPSGSLEDMAKTLRNRFTDDPETQRKALAFLVDRDALHNKTVRDMDERNSGTLWQGVLAGQGIGWLTQQPQYRAMDGNGQVKILQQVENFQKRNENDPANQVAQFAAFQKFCDDPKGLVAMTDTQIASYTGTLGPDLAKRLMGIRRQDMGSLDELRKATLNDIHFNDLAGEYGLKTKGTMAPTDLAALGSLRDQAMAAISTEQQATGKPLMPDRKEAIVRGLLTRETTNRGWYNPARWVGSNYAEDGPHLFQVKSFQDLNATEDEKSRALDYLRKSGAPATVTNVWSMVQAIRAQGGNNE